MIEIIKEIDKIFKDNNIQYCIIGSGIFICHDIEREVRDLDFLINKDNFNEFIKVRYNYFRHVFDLKKKRITYAYKKTMIDFIFSDSYGANTQIQFPKPYCISDINNKSNIQCIRPDIFIEYKLTTYLYAHDRNDRDIEDVKLIIKNFNLYNLKFDNYVVNNEYQSIIDII